MTPPAVCDWCQKPLEGKRADAETCGKSCRQARWRARVEACEASRTARPLRLAYADPPYPGLAHLYAGDPSFAGEVDTAAVLARLLTFDGWALSTSAAALPRVLQECTSAGSTIRIATWFKRPRPHIQARILNGWEALIFHAARETLLHFPGDNRSHPHHRLQRLQVTDTLITGKPRRRTTLPTSCLGMKPPDFCTWMFMLLGALPGDSLADLFPGSGIVTRAWKDYTRHEPTTDPPPRGANHVSESEWQ